MPSLGIVGIAGRLGSRIAVAAERLGVPVVLHATRQAWTGPAPDVLIDVSTVDALPAVVDYCGDHRVALLSATSGLTPEHRTMLQRLSAQVPVLRAANLSLGGYLHRTMTAGLAPIVAALAADGLATVGIVDRHPAYKADRPSATALTLRTQLTDGIAGAPEVTVDSIRAGVPVCEHDVRIALGDEELVLRHAVRDWSAYSAMAVRAASWLADRHDTGMYTMDDFYGWLLDVRPASVSARGGAL
jgi:4-hydroxy-tetrahydrodipicolinate reductase